MNFRPLYHSNYPLLIFQSNFDNHLTVLSEMTEIGETVSRMDQLLAEAKSFRMHLQADVDQAEAIIDSGKHLINVRGICPTEIVKPKCDELYRVCEMLSERIAKRIETLIKARELMERVEKVSIY